MLRNPVMFVVEIGACHNNINHYYITFLLENLLVLTFKFQFGFGLQLYLLILPKLWQKEKEKRRLILLNKQEEMLLQKNFCQMAEIEPTNALDLRKGDIVVASDNHIIPSDGEIVEGVALVDESAITGESAPVIRESGGDRSGVTGGTKILSGNVKIEITANPGETFLDQMIKMIESAKRQKTPNEIALEILLIGLTVLFIVVVFTLPFFSGYIAVTISIPILISLLVCLMPTTIGGLLPAIGIAGMERLMSHNVIALSGRAVEAAGDVNVVLLDKTGTITLGNRLATEFIPALGVTEKDLANAAMMSSLSDETPEGRSIVVLAKEKLHIRGRDIKPPTNAKFIEFSAETRMSGIDFDNKRIRKGATDAIAEFVKSYDGVVPKDVKEAEERIAKEGGTPLVVAENGKVLGVIRLKDVLKKGIKERLASIKYDGNTVCYDYRR